MPLAKITLAEFLANESKGIAVEDEGLRDVILAVSDACKRVSRSVSYGALAGVLGNASSINVQGEQQQKLDVIANGLFLKGCEASKYVAGMVSEEMERPFAVPFGPEAKYLLVFDPLDGSSNIDVNVTIGSIFSILVAPRTAAASQPQEYLQPGTRQVAAGYALYGPATMIVLTVGHGVHAFTLDVGDNEFILTHRDLKVPAACSEFAINASNHRFWTPAIRRYVTECLAGKAGVRGKDFNMRWVASLVAEAHRILMRGGVFLYPKDSKNPKIIGRLRLLYEANPIASIMEQAGARASTGLKRILDIVPTALHQRVPLIFGSSEEVDRIEKFHQDPELMNYDAPLFEQRGLFRPNH